MAGYNADGEALAAALDKNTWIMTQPSSRCYPAKPSLLLIPGRLGDHWRDRRDAEHCQHLLNQVRACAKGHGNTYCYAASYDDLTKPTKRGFPMANTRRCWRSRP